MTTTANNGSAPGRGAHHRPDQEAASPGDGAAVVAGESERHVSALYGRARLYIKECIDEVAGEPLFERWDEDWQKACLFASRLSDDATRG